MYFLLRELFSNDVTPDALITLCFSYYLTTYGKLPTIRRLLLLLSDLEKEVDLDFIPDEYLKIIKV